MNARMCLLLAAVAVAAPTFSMGKAVYENTKDVSARSGEEADPHFGVALPPAPPPRSGEDVDPAFSHPSGRTHYRASGDVNARSGEEMDPGFGVAVPEHHSARSGSTPYKTSGDVSSRSGEEADPGFGVDVPALSGEEVDPGFSQSAGKTPYRAEADSDSDEAVDPGFSHPSGSTSYKTSGDVSGRSGEEADPHFGVDAPTHHHAGQDGLPTGEEADPGFGVDPPAEHHHHHHHHHAGHDTKDHQHHNVFHKHSDGETYLYASCRLIKDLIAGGARDVSGTIDIKQKLHGGDIEVNYDMDGLEVEEELSVDVHQYGVFGSCLSMGEEFAPAHKEGFTFPASITSEGELSKVVGDDYGNVRSRKTFSHGTLVGSHSMIGRSIAVHKGGETLACCTIGHTSEARWASFFVPTAPVPEIEDMTLLEDNKEQSAGGETGTGVHVPEVEDPTLVHVPEVEDPTLVEEPEVEEPEVEDPSLVEDESEMEEAEEKEEAEEEEAEEKEEAEEDEESEEQDEEETKDDDAGTGGSWLFWS